MFPYYIFAVLMIALASITNSLFLTMDRNNSEPTQLTARLVKQVHDYAVSKADGVFLTINATMGGAAEIPKGYFGSAPIESYAVIVPANGPDEPAVRYVISFLPSDLNNEAERGRISGALDRYTVLPTQYVGVYDSAAGSIPHTRMSVPGEVGIADDDVYLATNMSPDNGEG